jgi:hypothetical protein
MTTLWVFAAFLATAAGGENSQIVVSVPGAEMTCTKQANRLICVLPLDTDVADQLPRAAHVAAKAPVYRPSTPTPALPAPEALTRLKAAAANIELAKSLLPHATTPEETVLAEQMLYRAKEQYRTAELLLHTVQGDLDDAPDPFEGETQETAGRPPVVCTADLAKPCNTPVGGELSPPAFAPARASAGTKSRRAQ